MNIKDIFRKGFKSQSGTHEIITYNSLVSIPDRDFFKDDQEKLALIDSYKQQYIQDLATKKYMLSSDFSDDGLLEEVAVNTDMLVYLVTKLDEKKQMSGNYRELTFDEIKERLVLNYKFELYMGRLNELELDTIMRIIALEEVKHEKPFLSPVKRRAIGNFHNLLTRDVYLLVSQRDAIGKEINNNFVMLDKTILDRDSFSEENSNYLSERLEMVKQIGSSVIPDKIEEIFSSSERLELKIAKIERELEIYAYKNAHSLGELTKKINELNEEIEGSVDHDSFLETDEFLNEFNVMEAKYRLFYEFGRNLVSEEEIFNLYRLKFNINTFDLVNPNYEVFEKNESKEFECYKEIVMKRIERIVRGENSSIEATFDSKSKHAIKLIISILKDGKKQIDAERILNDKLLFCLLLSLDENKAYGFNNFINKFTTFVGSEMKGCDQLGFSSYIPLSTAFFLIEVYNEVKKHYGIKKEHWQVMGYSDFYYSAEIVDGPCRVCDSLTIKDYMVIPKLYTLNKYKCNNYDILLPIPNGIEILNTDGEMLLSGYAGCISGYDETFCSILKQKIRSNSDGKMLDFPSSLRKIGGNIFEGCKLNRPDWRLIMFPGSNLTPFNFNDGIKVINDYPFGAIIDDPSGVTLPDSVEEFTSSDKMRFVKFQNFKNSKLLHDKNALTKFLTYMDFSGTIVLCDDEYEHTIGLSDNKFSWANGLDDIRIEFFSRLLEEDSGLKHLSRFPSCDKIMSDRLECLSADEIINELVRVIKDETGYKIEFVEKAIEVTEDILDTENRDDNVKKKKLIK